MFFLLYEHGFLYNILRYHTFRGFCSILTAFFISILIGGPFIRLVKKYQKRGQPIRQDGPLSHLTTKAGTPTMGGIIILFSVTLSVLLWGNLKNYFIWIALFAMLSSGLLGFLDDLAKIIRNSNYGGVRPKGKLLIQTGIALMVIFLICYAMGLDLFSRLYLPFFKSFFLDCSYVMILLGVLVIVGSSNAVNLTDGLDGLAIFPVMMSSLALATIAYVVGHSGFSQYLFIPYISNVGEIVIFLSAWVGASLGFLWFNAPPAKIFMGDTGSLAAGASLGTVALMIKHELIWALIGGIFVVEALSVMIQVYYYKMTRKRIFKMAPIHHHFEHLGWSESTIVIRFWIISVILALIGLASLKIR